MSGEIVIHRRRAHVVNDPENTGRRMSAWSGSTGVSLGSPILRNLTFLAAFKSCCAIAVIAVMTSCGGSNPTMIVGNPTGVSGMPPESAPGPSSIYIGAQGPGVWTLSLNDTSGAFSYQPVTYPAAPTTGHFTASNGFLNLGTGNGMPLGYILEVPGRMALLRPGGTTAPLVLAVPQTSCYVIPYRLRFAFVAMQAGASSSTPTVPIANGSFVVNTDTKGMSWQYQNLQGNAPQGPAMFSGSCTASAGQATMSLTGEGLINQYNYGNSLANYSLSLTTTLQIGPSGIFIVDQSDASVPQNQGLVQGSSAAGVAQSSSPLATSSVAGGSYLGFLTESSNNGGTLAPTFTSPVSFGPASSSGTTILGGIFPNDDVTQTPNADTSISLGTQDSTINGLYPSALVTTLDPAQNCATLLGNGANVPVTPGQNAQGYPTCTYPAVAMVGNPDGKFVILLNTFNYTANAEGSWMQIYLYQQ